MARDDAIRAEDEIEFAKRNSRVAMKRTIWMFVIVFLIVISVISIIVLLIL